MRKARGSPSVVRHTARGIVFLLFGLPAASLAQAPKASVSGSPPPGPSLPSPSITTSSNPASSTGLGTSASTGNSRPSAAASLAALQATNYRRVVQLNEEGNHLYTLGQYRKALERFLQAHAIDGDSNLLFNIGNCYEKMGNIEAAVEKYRQFVASEGVDPGGLLRATAQLQSLESQSKPVQTNSKALMGSTETRARGVGEIPSSTAKATSTMANRAALLDGTDPQKQEQWLRQQLPWIALATGGTFALAGGILYSIGQSAHSEVAQSQSLERLPNRTLLSVSSLTRQEATELVDSGNRSKTLGAVGLALAVGVLAAYVGVHWWDTRTAPPMVAMNPNPEQPSITVQGSF